MSVFLSVNILKKGSFETRLKNNIFGNARRSSEVFGGFYSDPRKSFKVLVQLVVMLAKLPLCLRLNNFTVFTGDGA